VLSLLYDGEIKMCIFTRVQKAFSYHVVPRFMFPECFHFATSMHSQCGQLCMYKFIIDINSDSQMIWLAAVVQTYKRCCNGITEWYLFHL